jgi:cell division septation protein DedD
MSEPARRAAGLALRVALAAAALAAPPPLAAQGAGPGRPSGGALEQVEELTRLGRTEEAREVLTGWWASVAGAAGRREMQRGLWLRGRLTVDPVEAELEFQRLVVLYPSGPYTPGALFRLAQAAHARGEGAAAEAHVAALVRDHPNSPVRREAEAWLRDAGPAERVAERPIATRVDTRREDTSGQYSVQLGAFADGARAFALLEEVRGAGIEARIVRVAGSRFVHVRVGRFEARPDAAQQLDALTRLGISAAIVRDERAEQAVRRAPGS